MIIVLVPIYARAVRSSGSFSIANDGSEPQFCRIKVSISLLFVNETINIRKKSKIFNAHSLRTRLNFYPTYTSCINRFWTFYLGKITNKLPYMRCKRNQEQVLNYQFLIKQTVGYL